MGLRIYPRGNRLWIRGTLRAGDKVHVEPGRSTRFAVGQEGLAEAYRIEEEHRILTELLHGRTGLSGTIADAIRNHGARPEPIARRDRLFLEEMTKEIGARLIADAVAAWKDFVAKRCVGWKPSAVRRARAPLAAALNRWGHDNGVRVPRLPWIKATRGERRVRWLPDVERDRLLGAYGPRHRPIPLVMAYGGTRSCEALQVQFEHLEWDGLWDRLSAHEKARILEPRDLGLWAPAIPDDCRPTIYVAQSKTLLGRTVPMHPKVAAALLRIWIARGRPRTGAVFLNGLGKPFPDTRDEPEIGDDDRLSHQQHANPLRAAHATACRRAAIADFTAHDWRHHWAVAALKAGMTVDRLKSLGGWQDLASLRRYIETVADRGDHDAIRRLA
jgi:integrase